MSDSSPQPSPRVSPDSSLTVSALGEFGLISRLARVLAPAGRDPLQPEATGTMGIGDDAAVWQPTPGAQQVLTTDALIEDVHFRHRTTGWRDLGWKALAENVSDIAAMGARPTRAFVTLGLRAETLVADLEELYRGLADLDRALAEAGRHHWDPAERLGVSVAGGDTVSSPFTLISVTVVGEVSGPGLRRAAGQPGDVLAVTGTLGGSSGGLSLLEAGGDSLAVQPADAVTAELLASHRRPVPRVVEGLVAVGAGLRCGMDLSDGLLGDAGKLAYASGLSALLDYERLPLSPALIRQFGEAQARALALAGGEDYELLVAGPPGTVAATSRELERRGLPPMTVVGRLAAGRPGQVSVVDGRGAPVPTPRGSWDHFRQGGPTV
ncbi:MAG: thiamine-phosphate kinase [Chloroflexi bacterium]|nr:thiamine-phosphate kinase [Chloroflexota bacterium]